MKRRGLLFGLLAAPAIIRTPGLLMPVKKPFEWLPSRIHPEDEPGNFDEAALLAALKELAVFREVAHARITA